MTAVDLQDANNGLGIQKDYQTYVTRPKKMNGQEVISSFLWATWIVENSNQYPYLEYCKTLRNNNRKNEAI